MKSRKGLALIELMIVVAIIGVMATILIPAVLRHQAKNQIEKTLGKNAIKGYDEWLKRPEVKDFSAEKYIAFVQGGGRSNTPAPTATSEPAPTGVALQPNAKEVTVLMNPDGSIVYVPKKDTSSSPLTAF